MSPWLAAWLIAGLAVLELLLADHRRTSSESPFEINFDEIRYPWRDKPKGGGNWLDRLAVRLTAYPLFLVSFLVGWPALLGWFVYEKLEKARWAWRDRTGGFRVRRAWLRERLTPSQAEAREWVEDPLGAVPPLPFGHLHAVWQRFVEARPRGGRLWSFAGEWTPPDGPPQWREGYVWVRWGWPCTYDWIVTLRSQRMPPVRT